MCFLFLFLLALYDMHAIKSSFRCRRFVKDMKGGIHVINKINKWDTNHFTNLRSWPNTHYPIKPNLTINISLLYQRYKKDVFFLLCCCRHIDEIIINNYLPTIYIIRTRVNINWIVRLVKWKENKGNRRRWWLLHQSVILIERRFCCCCCNYYYIFLMI